MVWKKVKEENDGGPSFRVVTYNVLAEKYAKPKQFPNCPDFALKWEHRRENLVKEIGECQADIICLQEVQQNHYSDFFRPALLQIGYEGAYKGKVRENYSPTVDGCATFWKLDEFELIDSWSMDLNHDKDNIALQAILRSKNAGQPLCIGNTHIHANRRNSHIKLLQVNCLLKRLEEFAKNDDVSLILCGDFNSMPGTAAHSLLTKGYVHHPLPEEILRNHPTVQFRHSVPFANAYSSYSLCDVPEIDVKKKLNGETGEPRFTNFVKNDREIFQGTLDYIFYTATKFKVVSLLELVDEEEVKDRGLPSVIRSSDHIPIGAEFCYIHPPQK